MLMMDVLLVWCRVYGGCRVLAVTAERIAGPTDVVLKSYGRVGERSERSSWSCGRVVVCHLVHVYERASELGANSDWAEYKPLGASRVVGGVGDGGVLIMAASRMCGSGGDRP